MATLDEISTENYFDAYDNIGVHSLMLRDKPRMEKYREAIMKSKNIFKEKIVLDCGSGTGILSMFAAQAGAKKVYAIEASDSIHELSKALIRANNLQDKIELIHGVIEKIELPVQEVDIILSEWMGFYLVHESMLNSVLYARDKWLRKDGQGHMYPSVAYLYACPVEMTDYFQENLNFWSNFYGLDFAPFMKVYRQLMLEKPLVEHLKSRSLVDDEKILASFDLKTVRCDDLETIQEYDMEFRALRDANLHGFAFWFDVVFTTDDDIVTLSTGPSSEPTHWKQTVAILPDALDNFIENNNQEACGLALREDDKFKCFIILNQADDNPRNYQIDIGVELGENAENQESDKEEEEEEEEDDDESEHPMPCDCGSMRCLIIKATLEKYENEQTDVENG